MSAQLLEILRNQYLEARKKYGPRFINLDDLEGRIAHLRGQKTADLKSFFHHEMDFLKKLCQLAEKKIRDEAEKAELHRKIDALVAENDGKIKQYPDHYFDPLAGFEIRHLVGAVTVALDKYRVVLEYVFRGSPDWGRLLVWLGDLERFYLPLGSAPNVLLRHYIDELKSRGENEREKIERQLMQTAGLALFRLARFCQETLAGPPAAWAKQKIDLPATVPSATRIYWKGAGFAPALEELSDYFQGILTDFRLQDLVSYAHQKNGH